MFLGKAFTSSMLEASAAKAPFSGIEVLPSRRDAADTSLSGDIDDSLVPKNAVTSITTLPPLRAIILNPLRRGLAKFFLKAAAMGSLGSTTLLFCIRLIYTLRSSLVNSMSIGVLIICPATKSWVSLVDAIRLARINCLENTESGNSNIS